MVKCFWRVLAVACLIGVSAAVPAASVDGNAEGRNLGRNSIQTDDLMDNIYSDCLKKDSVSCVKYKLFSFMDKVISSKDSFALADGVTVVKTGGSDGSPRSLDEDKSDDVETMFVNRVEKFLETHTLKFDVKGTDVLSAVSNAGRALGDAADSLGLTESEGAVEESRGKKKKAAKILLPLLLAFKLKAAALIPLALGAIALIAGKALIIGKIALVLAAIIGLKKLLHHQKSVTYEIVSHPHHSTSHQSHEGWSGGDFGSSGSGGHGGWGRSTNDAQNMAYRAYQPQQ